MGIPSCIHPYDSDGRLFYAFGTEDLDPSRIIVRNIISSVVKYKVKLVVDRRDRIGRKNSPIIY